MFGGAGSGCNFVYMCIYNYTEGDSRLEEVNGMFIYCKWYTIVINVPLC